MKETEASKVAAIPEALEELVPSFRGKVTGVDDAIINALETAAKRTLPDAYRAFLRWGGKKFIPDLWGADPTASSLLNIYQRGEWLPPREYLLIAIAKPDVDSEEDVYLRNPDSAEPAVVTIPFPQGGTFAEVQPHIRDYGAPFSAVLFGRLFLQLYLRPMAYTDYLEAGSKRENIIHEIHATLKELGFVRHHLSGKDCAVYTGPNAAALLSRSPGEHTVVHVGTQDLQVHHSIINTLQRRYQMHIATKLPKR